MSFTSVDLSELFTIINLNANSILKDILNMLLLSDLVSLFIIKSDHFLEIGRMAPGNLDCCGGLGYVGEDALEQGVL
jgi:hypothetical protein